MTTYAFEGAAGCGKTYQLMSTLDKLLSQSPLRERQRILAITFMHGSKKRLSEKLGTVESIRKKYVCMTVDAFALHLLIRWKSLAEYMKLPQCDVKEYDKCCKNAAQLLRDPIVVQWVASSFPIVIIDEAQDLSYERLPIVQALAGNVNLIAAADEFQCLVEKLKPNPMTTWLPTVCSPKILTIPRRTTSHALLNAAIALRTGTKLLAENEFKIFTGATTILAGNFVSNGVAWGNGSDVAIITPTIKGRYAQDIVSFVATQKSKRGNGPYSFNWESSDDDYVFQILGNSFGDAEYHVEQAIAILRTLPSHFLLQSTIHWLQKQSHILGRKQLASTEIRERLVRYAEIRRQSLDSSGHRLKAMTVHQAKNREFDGVIVLWPIKSKVGQDEQKRRLLYNAVTRARKWCTVIVQKEDMLSQAPFL